MAWGASTAAARCVVTSALYSIVSSALDPRWVGAITERQRGVVRAF